MYAFGWYDYVRESLINTAGNCNNILSYCLYWVLSVYDYYFLTNDNSIIQTLNQQMTTLINQSIAIFSTNPNLGFYGT